MEILTENILGVFVVFLAWLNLITSSLQQLSYLFYFPCICGSWDKKKLAFLLEFGFPPYWVVPFWLNLFLTNLRKNHDLRYSYIYIWFCNLWGVDRWDNFRVPKNGKKPKKIPKETVVWIQREIRFSRIWALSWFSCFFLF